jgi:GNAT superfamily N-acetyltransferase
MSAGGVAPPAPADAAAPEVLAPGMRRHAPGTGARTAVRTVAGRRDLRRFIEYPFSLYRRDPYWVPPLLVNEWQRFDARRNPFLQHARIQPFLAERDGRLVGRIAAIDDDHHNATHRDNVAFFGFFEAADQDAASALLAAAEAWARDLGRAALRGPANPSMNDGSGFQIDAFDTVPFVMMPFNPPAYPHYVEAAGYRKVKDLYAWLFHDAPDLGARIVRLAERVERRYRPVVRPLDTKHFERDLGLLKRIYAEAWQENWGFVRYTDAEFDHLAAELKLIIDPEINLFIELGGEIAGVAINLPDINQVLQKINGRLLPFGILALLNRRRQIDRTRLPILGILPGFRMKGLELVLIKESLLRWKARGYRSCECSWVLEDNDAINAGIRATGGTLYKTYRLYQKSL